MNIEQLSNEVQEIKDDLNKLGTSVLSQQEKETRMKEIKDKANDTKDQLEKEMATLNDEEREKAQVLLDSLNEIINIQLSIVANQQMNNVNSNNETGNGNGGNGEQPQESGEPEQEEKGLRKRRNGLSNGRKKGIRIGGGAIAGLGIWKLGKRIFGGKKEKKEDKSFWERPFGKFFKWTGIGTGVYYISHGFATGNRKIKDAFNWKKDDSENPDESNNTPENETPNSNTPENETPNNETPAENGEQTPNPDNNSGEENAEVFEATNANTFSNAAINTLNEAKSLDTETKNKIKTTLNTYLQEHPILKKSANGHMLFEIGNKTKFSNTLKKVWNDVLSGLNMIERGLAKAIFGGKLDNIDSTMRGLKAKDYENVVFKYLGGIVKETVKAENGSMTVQEFYNSIKKYYPNNNASTIETHLAQSGQLNKDIKDMDIEKIVKA